MDLAPNIRDLSKITTEEISADLDYLASKHPEMFSKPSDVFRLIKEIKNEPTHFFNNYRLDYALVAKRLNDKKIGKLAINKESGEVRHATKVRERDLARMDRVSKQMAGTSTLPTPLSTADNNVLKQDATSVGKTYSSADESIIPQKDKEEQKVVQQASIKTNNNESIKTIVENLSRNREIALKLNPKADLLMAVKDFSKPIETPIFKAKVSIDKMLNHIIEKPNGEKRLSYLNLVKPTLENPLFITKEENRYRFVKTFIDDKEKVLKFLSVIENNKGEVLGITATPIKNTDIKNLIKGDIVWGGDTLSSLSTPQAVKRELDTDKDIIAQNSKDSVEKLLTAIDTSSDKVGLVKKVLLNKDISDGVKAKAVNRLTKNKISQGVKTSYISTKNSKNN
ncbi:PBECR2 nuclease fold domain-containing protein [Campylobacter concisus]|uniref:PBECR2 nuclease fold domain-containing protein n=1 Tax=Campylobacter concisus TaxID=199 RepID=UPI00112FCFE6|nr:PBECR2 nuclease fold domain-containing protein [Campylobacter concisus]